MDLMSSGSPPGGAAPAGAGSDTVCAGYAQFARLGTVRIKFLGGEPLLRDDIGELVQEVRRLGMRSAMVTNGFLIPEKMEVVRRLDELVISLDGDQAAHDRQRGRGTWKRVMRAVELCAAEGLDFFLTAVVTRESASDIDWLLDTARRFGVMVNFQIPQFNEEMYGKDAAVQGSQTGNSPPAGGAARCQASTRTCTGAPRATSTAFSRERSRGISR